MVALSEVESTFWGLCLEAGKKYSQTVEKCFHISMAAVDPHKSKGSEPVTLYLEKDGVEYVICTLVPGKINQQQLDLNFNMGEDINLFIKEKGSLHLTGYLVEDNDMDDFSEGEDFEDEEEEEEDEPVQGKRKLKQLTTGGKKAKLESFIDDEAEECDEEEEDEMFEMTGDEDDDEEMPEVPQKKDKKKKEKKVSQNGEKKIEPLESEKSPSEGTSAEKKKKKKKKNKNKEEKTPEVPKAVQTPAEKSKKRTIKGGVIVEELKEGHGPEAVNGKKVMLYYTGKLQSGKVFDSTTSGKPFDFKLGKKDVIPGWDLGILGMKVGGKRRLTIPPSMGYGNKQNGPIPGNSTLVFDVELKGVN